ncbi:envelope glycoprotein H [Proboscivirus elephantidbeta5]|uniref:Envelope glycoprotein H n=3 Tax=Elephant endotheliotropic herpesvirus 5 TaxID=768738 RepID=A0A075CYK6_9BETA|nr:envelope glycoprotein H [Elephant endotheliotropic herpesvirus 5]AHC02777.1 envelope glycoprotein H [Elephant endotheliotropic herpesvirus 5]
MTISPKKWKTLPIKLLAAIGYIDVVVGMFNLSSLHSESCFRTPDLSSENIDFTPNLLTFRFFSNDTHSQTFHIPKCIFDSALTTHLFNHLNIYSDVSSYKKEFETYYMGSVEGTYKTIIIKGEDKTPYLERTKTFIPNDKTDNSIITYGDDKKRYMDPWPLLSLIDDNPCEVFDELDEKILPYFGKCRPFYLNFDSVKLVGHITSSFATFSYTSVNGTDSYKIRIFFGNSGDVVHALPFESQDLAVRMMLKHDLEIIGKTQPVRDMLNKYLNLESLDKLFEENHEDIMNDLKHMCSTFYRHIQLVLSGDITKDTLKLEHLLEPLLTFSIAYYVQYSYPSNDNFRGIESYINTEAMIQLSPELFELFANNMTVETPVRRNGSSFIDLLLSTYSFTNGFHNGNLNHLGLSLYFLKFIYQKNVTEDIAEYVHRYIDVLYGRYTYPESLKPENMYRSVDTHDVMDLFMMNTMVIYSRNNKSLLHHFLLRQTGLCNVNNIISHYHRLKDDHRDFGSLVSPCFRCLRYDFTEKKINDLITTESLEAYGRLFQMVNYMTRNSSMLNTIDCSLPEEDVLAIVPLNDKIYVVSSSPVVTGTVYEAQHTAIGLSLYVTRVQNNTCIHLTNIYAKDTPKAVYTFNLDESKDCDVCPSVLLEYTTNTGFTNLYVIRSTSDVKYIAKNSDLFPLTSHYMWILKNDTVLELRGTNFFIFSSKSPGAIVLYIIIISLIIWTLYEIIKLFCYKRQWQYQKL